MDDPGLLVASGGTGTWLLVTAPPSHVFDCDYQVRRSGDDGATWSTPIPLAVAPGGSCNALNVVTDGVGAWVSAWHSDDALGGTVGTDLDIHVARSVDDGMTWSAPAPLNTTAATDGADSDRSPRLATDRAGRWVAVWGSRNTLGGTLSPLPTPADHHLLVSHSTDAGVTWTPPFALNYRAATELDEETPAELVTDGAGIWLMYGSYPPLSAVTVSRSVDHGLTWTEPTVLHGAVTIGNTTFENPAGLATDGSGTWVAGIQRGDVFVGTTLCRTARPDCVAPVVAGKAKLAITDKTPNVRDGLKWAWLAGDATTLADLGDPLATTTYTLCIYDAAGRVITGSRVPPGGTCSGKPCWCATATGFVYKAGAPTDSPFGISKMKLRAGDAGKAKVVLGARGESLATPPLGGTQKPLVAQLEASDTGACWEATYSTALKETPLKLKARAD